LSTIVIDDKNRVLLTMEVRKIAGVKKGDKLVAISFRGGVMLVNAKGKKFAESLTGFSYKEEEHEAEKFLFKEKL